MGNRGWTRAECVETEPNSPWDARDRSVARDYARYVRPRTRLGSQRLLPDSPAAYPPKTERLDARRAYDLLRWRKPE